MDVLRALARLEKVKAVYGGTAASEKLRLLRDLDRRRLATSGQVLRLHEVQCFLQAYPDNRAILAQVEVMLARFGRRSDLRGHAEALADGGMAGTPTYYSFFWPTARWLTRRCPGQLTIDWDAFKTQEQLDALLGPLVTYAESPALDAEDFTTREWLARLKGPRETDAAFLVRRFEALGLGTFTTERLYESLDVPLRIGPGPLTPTRTGAKVRGTKVYFQTVPLVHARPSLLEQASCPPLRVRAASPREGRRLLDMAVEAMITRARDLDAFAWGDPRDVFVVDFEDGLQFAGMGLLPERRLLLEASYGFLTLKNGVPIGYVLASSLFNSSEIAYNVFETFRGGEAAHVFSRVLAMTRHLFGAEAFTIDPYQLGHDNTEGQKSGAWWFYYKLGFRPEDPGVRRILREELSRMKRRPGHRSSLDTLQNLSAEHMILRLRDGKQDLLADCGLGQIGLRIVDLLAKRFGANREEGTRALSREAARLLGVRSYSGFSAGEHLAWGRWSPLVLCLPGVERWSAREKAALVAVVRAKGGRRESEYVARFDAHRRLRSAVWRLGAPAGEQAIPRPPCYIFHRSGEPGPQGPR